MASLIHNEKQNSLSLYSIAHRHKYISAIFPVLCLSLYIMEPLVLMIMMSSSFENFIFKLLSYFFCLKISFINELIYINFQSSPRDVSMT